MIRRMLTSNSRRLAAAALVTSLLAASHAAATGESGDVCIGHYQPDSNCTANDVAIDTLVPELIDPCNGPGDTATVQFTVGLVSYAAANRHDIGVFLATDGGSANGGSQCYHDYLAPPLVAHPNYTPSANPDDPYVEVTDGPWFDADSDACGDMERDSTSPGTSGLPARSVITLPPITIACADTTSDGVADIDACVSFNPSLLLAADICNGVAQAFPTTKSRCWCNHLEIPGLNVPPATTTTLPSGTTTTVPDATTTTLPATTTTTVLSVDSHFPVPTRVVSIKPGRVFKFIADGDFAGPADDPTIDGATLTFTTSTGGQTYVLPPSCWTAGSDPSKGYLCDNGDCTVRVKPGLVKAVCRPDTGTFTVPNIGDVDIDLTIGANSQYCAECGGTPAGNPDTTYVRKLCAAPPTCP